MPLLKIRNIIPPAFTKVSKLFFWLLLPLLFISNIRFDDNVYRIKNHNEDVSYVLKTKGSLNEDLSGKMVFEIFSESYNGNTNYEVLKLRLIGHAEIKHSIEFLISTVESGNDFSVGKYHIARDSSGWLGYYNGVFGFANIESMGEIPLFAQNGFVNLKHINEETIEGTLHVFFKNANGKSIDFTGDFVASKE